MLSMQNDKRYIIKCRQVNLRQIQIARVHFNNVVPQQHSFIAKT